ncbi:MAG: GTPase ObgE [Bacteroides sp.]|nr:GTPase ObgE [Roseburia sp.]MCM1462066.1 GTPase ObgE [Bacteroides sp.]
MFVDIVKITVKAGDGGNGAVSFHREKYVNAGGPDGGNGGKGGDVVFRAKDSLSTLIDFRYKKKYTAENGAPGAGKRSSGKSAPDTVIYVPRGTLVRDTATGRILADLSGDDPVIVAKGGKGGKGNMNFATPTRQIPRFAKPGYPGEQYDLTLELKLLADVGLVGFPNVGKSSLISVVSAAKPEIANYHFTTITPVLGVVKFEEKSFVMADIPGLIEGASDGAGLGHAFLRHVERCRLILHIVDVSESEGRDAVDDLIKIERELERFSPALAERPRMLAANKADLASAEQIERLRAYAAEREIPFFVVSAATTAGTRELVAAVAARLDTLPPMLRYEPEPPTLAELDKIEKEKRAFTVKKADAHYFLVDAPWLAPILSSVNMEDYESLQYFQRVLRGSGIIDALEAAGIEEKDTVAIFDFEFDYVR